MITYESIFPILLGCFCILLCKFLHFLTFLYEKTSILCFAMILHNLLGRFCNSPSVLVSRDYTTFAQWSHVLLDVSFYLYKVQTPALLLKYGAIQEIIEMEENKNNRISHCIFKRKKKICYMGKLILYTFLVT